MAGMRPRDGNKLEVKAGSQNCRMPSWCSENGLLEGVRAPLEYRVPGLRWIQTTELQKDCRLDALGLVV